ncbi:zinc-binding dehydrogenase [Embleya sp. NPDC059237]|uniref:zinc-binding dehydrogenase n=1 Tax=Embleya sp. NPDC059237 TaxID=3346784 RepID=UPI0036A19F76
MTIERIELADPGPGEVLVRTVSAGICGTDLHFAAGTFPYPLPTVLGHEASGVVELVGQGVTDIGVGDNVIVCDQTFCGRCPACLSGHMVYCADTGPKQREHQRMTIAGMPARQYLGVSAFAEHMLVDANALIPMPPGLGFDTAALLSCCLTTGLATVFNVARVRPGDRVAVLGCGGVGLGAVQAARIAGATQIIAIDPIAHRRDIAVQLGATDILDPTATPIVEAVLKLSDGGVDHAIEAVGQATTAAEAFAMLRPAGQATVLGMMPPGTDIPIPGRLLRQGRKLVGTVMGSVRTRADIPRYAQLALTGQLNTDLLVTSGRSLDDTNAALTDAQAHRGVREMLHF